MTNEPSPLTWQPKPSGDGFYWYLPSYKDSMVFPRLPNDVEIIEVWDNGSRISVADSSVGVAEASGLFYGPLVPPPLPAKTGEP